MVTGTRLLHTQSLPAENPPMAPHYSWRKSTMGDETLTGWTPTGLCDIMVHPHLMAPC